MAAKPIEPARVIPFPGTLPPAVIQRIAFHMIERHSPREIADAIEILMDLLDALGGDPDAEELPQEDAFVQHDPAFAGWVADNEAGAYAEWASLSAAQRRHGACVVDSCGNEDDEADDHGEDDDPAGQSDEDGINTGNGVPYLHGGFDHSGPGCPISDPGEPDGLRLRKVKAGEDWEPQCT